MITVVILLACGAAAALLRLGRFGRRWGGEDPPGSWDAM